MLGHIHSPSWVAQRVVEVLEAYRSTTKRARRLPWCASVLQPSHKLGGEGTAVDHSVSCRSGQAHRHLAHHVSFRPRCAMRSAMFWSRLSDTGGKIQLFYRGLVSDFAATRW